VRTRRTSDGYGRADRSVKAGFSAFLGSLFLSRLADQVLLFLVPLVVYQTTQSVAWSGVAFFVETLPRYLSFPVCGVLCDRYSPLKLLRSSQLLRACACIAGIAGELLFGGIGWLVALSAISGVLTTQGVMAREVMLPHVSGGRPFQQTLAYAQAVDQVGAVLGPVLAAFLLTRTPWQASVVVAALLFFLADMATSAWKRMSPVQLPAPEGRHHSVLAPIRTAFRHVLRAPGLLRLVVLAAGLNLVVGVTLASSAAIVTGFHGRGTSVYAVLQVAGAAVTMLVLLTIARTRLPLGTMGIAAYLLVLAGGLMTIPGPSFALYAAGFLFVIGFDKMFNIYMRTSRQRIIPQQDYGKTTGVLAMLNNLTQPLAGLLIGVFSGHSGAAGVILWLSAGMAVLGAVAVLCCEPCPPPEK